MSTDTSSPDPATTAGVTGTYTRNGTPISATSLTPFIVVPRAEEALEFYRDVFAARIVDVTRMPGADGTTVVAHAVLSLGNGLLQLGEAIPDYHLVNAPEGDDDCYSLGLYCPDTDAVIAQAVAAGATVREEATTFVSGDRFASIRDPFGVRWSIMTRVEDLSDEESNARVAEWAAQFSQSPESTE